MAPILTVKELAISFGSNHVLKSVSLELGESEVLGVIGPTRMHYARVLSVLEGMRMVFEQFAKE